MPRVERCSLGGFAGGGVRPFLSQSGLGAIILVVLVEAAESEIGSLAGPLTADGAYANSAVYRNMLLGIDLSRIYGTCRED